MQTDRETAGVGVQDMMRAREARAQAQMLLLARHPGAVVVGLTMNIAGPVKINPAIERAFAWGESCVRAVLASHEVLFAHAIAEVTGPEALFCVRADAAELKRRLCVLEDGCAMGRLLDVDVIGPDGVKLSRTDVGLPARRCLLCDQPAPVCARSRTHSAQALFDRAMAIIAAHEEETFVRRVGAQAQRALLCEVAVTPKPGLVDRANAGAHRDMDMFTFMDSAVALRPYFEQCASVGLAHRGGDAAACFDALRVPGLLAEADMCAATGGVNTHRGAIFSLGIACASLGMGFDPVHCDAVAALARCGEMTRVRMAQEMKAARPDAPRYGEALCARTGVGGVRREAAEGFPAVREAALPRLRQALAAGMDENDAGLCALVALMARTEDTNAIRRGGMEAAKALRARAQALDARLCAAMCTQGFDAGAAGAALRRELSAWDAELTRANISPGGCADMLALAFLTQGMEG